MPITDYTPTPAEVAKLLLARTVNEFGSRVGTFDATTRPTGTEVESLITEAANEIASVVGEDLPDAPGTDPDAIRGQAKAVVQILAAMNVELTYFQELIGTPKSAYTALERRLESALKRLKERVAETRGSGDGESVAASSGFPRYNFPGDAGGMLGWRTRW